MGAVHISHQFGRPVYVYIVEHFVIQPANRTSERVAANMTGQPIPAILGGQYEGKVTVTLQGYPTKVFKGNIALSESRDRH